MAIFQFDGVCYPTARHAQTAWLRQFPKGPDGSGVLWNVSSYTLPNETTGVFSSTLSNSVTGATAVSSVGLLQCDGETSLRIFNKYPIQDVSFAAAFIFAAFVGFAMGRKK